MNNSSAPDSGAFESPIRGTKRKTDSPTGESAKRLRGNQTPTDSDCQISHYNLDFLGDWEEDSRITSSVATPLTPFSPKTSPRHPSDIFKIHRCTYEDCGKSFNRPAKLSQHLRSHTNSRPFLCPHALCTKDFLRESHLKHHVKSAHSDVRDYVCEWEGCGKSFVTATRLKRHHATHEGQKKFRCTIAGCGQTFRKHGTLQRHIVIAHEGRRSFICKVPDFDGIECGAGFDTKGQLEAHCGRLHGPNTFLCTICPPERRSTIGNSVLGTGHASFSTRTELRAHIQNEHPPICIECGQEFKSLRDLKSHLEMIHGSFGASDSKAYFCHEEGYEPGLTKEGNLGLHIQTSQNPTLFVCGGTDPSTLTQVTDWDGRISCGKALTTKASLEEHIRTAHQELVPSHQNKSQTKQGIFAESAPKHQVSILTRLTGTDYEEQSGRKIPCLVTGCSHRFLREYDLEIHLQSRHGLEVPRVQEMVLDEGELYSRQTLQGLQTYIMKQEVANERALDMQADDGVDGAGHEATLGAEASRGGDSCPQEQSYLGKLTSDEWLHDELEMRCLIDGGLEMESHETISGQEVDVIHPALL